MPKLVLNLDNVGEIDAGALRIAVNNALKLVNQDMADRPALEKKRVVALVIEMKPVMDTNSSQPHLESVDLSWFVKTTSPAIGSDGVSMKPQQDGQLYFHSDLPDSPDDETIMDEAERRRQQRMNRAERAD
jgi:hypothetical protein